MRKAASALLLVGILMLMTTAMAASASSHSKAKFSASSGIFAVGPGHLLGIPDPANPAQPAMETTDITVRLKKRDPAVIRSIKVHTVNEGVLNDSFTEDGPFNGPGTQVGPCTDNDGGGACDATTTVLQGSAILWLHESTATLTKVVEGSLPVFDPEGSEGDPPLYWFKTYSGKLRGKLRGEFGITGLTGPVVGEAKLQIKGTATYACVMNDGATPLPDVSYCEGEGNPNLFAPIILNIVDTGHFKAVPFPGVPGAGLADDEHQLVRINGKLQVTVDAAGGVLDPTTSGIVISKARAKFVVPAQ